MIKQGKNIVVGLFLAVVSVVAAQAQQDVVVRVQALENNSNYMSLLRSDAQLRQRSDSLMSAIRNLRGEISRNAESRDSLAQVKGDSLLMVLTDAEGEVLSMRTQMIKLVDQINAIEQEHVLASMGNIGGAAAQASGSIFTNEYFRKSLEKEDYDALMAVQAKEQSANEKAKSYVANYGQIKELYNRYVQARAETDAGAVYGELAVVLDENTTLERDLSEAWNEIYDQKSYVYAYFLEKEGREDILELTEAMLSEAQQEKLLSVDNCVSEPLADYRLQKPIILNYETYVAKLLNLTSSIDSLSAASRDVRQIDYRLAKIDVERRSFVDYQAIEFLQRSPYTNSNPVPDCVVYEYGTIYRILMGTYKYKQAVSIFRGAVPLCVETLEDGRFSYYAGGFRSRAEAEKAVEVMKKKGFRNPQIVEWCDGYKTNLSEVGSVSFRLMISGGTLDDSVRNVIETMAPDCQLSRLAEDSFAVGMFSSRAMAERVAQAIVKSNEGLSVDVEELQAEEEEE